MRSLGFVAWRLQLNYIMNLCQMIEVACAHQSCRSICCRLWRVTWLPWLGSWSLPLSAIGMVTHRALWSAASNTRSTPPFCWKYTTNSSLYCPTTSGAWRRSGHWSWLETNWRPCPTTSGTWQLLNPCGWLATNWQPCLTTSGTWRHSMNWTWRAINWQPCPTPSGPGHHNLFMQLLL